MEKQIKRPHRTKTAAAPKFRTDIATGNIYNLTEAQQRISHSLRTVNWRLRLSA